MGRALAHRLKGKFFLIDGTVVAGGSDFYDDVGKVFEEAKRNAPAIIFIDDSDVIFEVSGMRIAFSDQDDVAEKLARSGNETISGIRCQALAVTCPSFE